jgi:hypothetical protein
MRCDDLLDAQASVDWAVTQIPILQDKLAAWNAKRPYEIMTEIDPKTGANLLVAYLMGPLDPIVNAELGVIVNSIRTALDLLAASLCRRNGNKPSADTHFPIFGSEQCMIDPLTGIEGKKWLSKRERAAIKALRPYKGGDHTLWSLHQLDILRKHERLISARPDVSAFSYRSGPPREGRGYLAVSGERTIERSEYKTVLIGFIGPVAQALDMTKGNAHVSAHVTFNEADLGIINEEVATTLTRFAARVSEIVKMFDGQ